MKRLLFIALLALALVALVGAGALAGIANSKHDLSATSSAEIRSINESQICIFCHTPHSANPAVPLWNRAALPGTPAFTVYQSSTLQGTVDSFPTGGSDLCLSCHDGTVALNNILNTSSVGTPTMVTSTKLTNGMLNDTSTAYLGRDLSNDHPVSITYNHTADLGLRAPSGNYVVSGSMQLPLFNNKVQCGSCHNVHDPTNTPFLRYANTGSQLCLVCHNK